MTNVLVWLLVALPVLFLVGLVLLVVSVPDDPVREGEAREAFGRRLWGSGPRR